jgi:hypothetical protein
MARHTVKTRLPLSMIGSGLIAVFASALVFAATTVSHLRVHVVTGAAELTAGSTLELRIYEAGKAVRRLPLSHGEAWPGDSTRLIPITLAEPLDPRAVSRFSLYYRAASPLTPAWEVVAADVELAPADGNTQRLLDATLAGVMSHQGELATEERDASSMACTTDADCDDHRKCNGHEKCAPRSTGADARGCVKGLPLVCPVNEVCSEEKGCRGPDSIAAK